MEDKTNRQCNKGYKINYNSESVNYTIDMKKYDTSTAVYKYLPHNPQVNYLDNQKKYN